MSPAVAAPPVEDITFPAMGTEARLVAVGGPSGAVDAVRRLVDRLEGRWSRFRPDSELSRLNAAAGRPVTLRPDTFALVEAAVAAWSLTGGLFDPTVLPALAAAGYDRSFEFLGAGPAGCPRPDAGAPVVPGCAGILLDRRTGLVQLPPGSALDLGGVAKGHTADRAVATLLAVGAAGALADLGGDIRVAGLPPDGETAWPVVVDDPHRPGRDLAGLALAEGAVATSSRIHRRWTRDGQTLHHLIDPATGRPAGRGIDAAVVVAGSAARAEVLAKAAVIAGAGAAPAFLAGFGATGLLVLESGEAVQLPGLGEYRR